MRVRYLIEFDGSRSNNFSALRLFFAFVVLYGHSYPISGNDLDPVSRLLMPYTWIGALAVHGFFAISGFLVTASFANRGAVPFIVARGLRLYPAVILYCIVAILIIGPLGVSVPLDQYFGAGAVQYLRNAPLWTWQVNLPYAFADRPFSGSTNGSTWTLPIELRSYLLVLGVGVVGVWKSRIASNVALLGLFYLMVFGEDVSGLFADEDRYRHPMAFFLAGSAAWVNRDLVLMSVPLAVVLAFAQLLFLHGSYFLAAHAICGTYVILVMAYMTPRLDIDRFGDVSYGVYLYAWPIQQLVWWQGQGGLTNALIAAPIVTLCAYASWRLVEKPALGLKSALSGARKAPS